MQKHKKKNNQLKLFTLQITEAIKKPGKKVRRKTKMFRISSRSYNKIREISWEEEKTMSAVVDEMVGWYLRNKLKNY